jgi:hypothetical protein
MIRLVCLLSVCLLSTVPAFAQQKEPVSGVAFDVRGVFARHKAEPSVATDLGVPSSNLPPRSWGLAGGGHIYVWKTRHMSLGVGATTVWSHGSKFMESTTTTSGTTTTTFPAATVRRHFLTLSPEVSFNFGHRNGWSYISGGMFGASRLYLDREDRPASNVPWRKTLNYGGGARWFNTEHLAFSVDFHWYSVAEQLAAPGVVAEPRTTLLVLSGGISIR